MLVNYIKKSRIVFSLLITSLFLEVQAQTELPKNFEAWIENYRQEWKIPGMAVGIVKDGKIIYAKGFGEKKLGSGEKVDENTVFGIASASKNMTAAALAVLVDEGKINWDDKITQHIPWFQMKDPWITNELTIRDALIHRSGLGRILGNRLQFMTNSSRDEVLFQVRYMDLEKPFRTSYVYSNVMYSLAGQIIEYVDGRTWDEFLQDRFFKPMGMKSTTTSITELKEGQNLAFPHQEIDGEIVTIQRRNWDNAGPAAGVNSSVIDMSKWLMLQLGESGKFDGKTYVSEEQMNEIHKPQLGIPPRNSKSPQMSYGLGWHITDYKGYRVLDHGGATDGFNTAMYLFPELDLGIIVFVNTFSGFGNAVAYQVADHFIDGKNEVDWGERYLTNYRNAYERASTERQKIHDARMKNTQPTLNLDAYVGKYKSEAYGEVEVKKNGNQLVLHFWENEGLEAKLEHWHFDTFRAIWKNKAQREEFMQFHLGKDGKVEALDFEFVLRPMLLQVGAYPSNYTHTERFNKL